MDPPLRFRFPLSPAVLDDPAFSPDPRSHPHFPLTNALSYKAVPSKSPFHPPLIVPTTVLKPVSTNVSRKARMKTFVRRLTTRHNLDPIDELDETDPFGSNFHHDGPYEAIVSNLEQPTRNPVPPRHNMHRSKRESDPHPLRPCQQAFAHRLPPPYDDTGLSLHLKPGQILQSNTIYTSGTGHFLPQPNAASIAAKPDPPRRQSLPNPRIRPYQDPPPCDPRDGLQSSHSASPPTHRERYLGGYAPDTPNRPLLFHDHDTPPYVHHQIPKSVVPPPRYESRLDPSGPPRSPQRIPPPSVNPAPPQTQSTENVLPAPRHNSRHKTVHSLNSHHTMRDAFTQSSSSIQSKPLDPPRIRHVPKRLVMPAPLQPQQPQSYHKFPPAEPPAWQDEYLDDPALKSAHFQAKPVMYSQEPRLLRKRSSVFPASTPIPDHVPMSQDDATPIIGFSSTKTVNEGVKEKARRRRLSKRKNDI